MVGGGVIGLACAWRLLQKGLSVTLLERSEPGAGTSRVAAGMLAPATEAESGEGALVRLGIASAGAYPAFVTELREVFGIDPGYLACGTLMVARDRDEAEAVDRELAFRRSLSLNVERVLPGRARALEPALAPGLRLALDFPDDHAVDPRRLVDALVEAVRRTGGLVRAGSEVAEVVVEDGRVRGVSLTTGERIRSDAVLVAAGAWSRALGGLPAEAQVPSRPVKGQIMRLHDPAGPGLLSRVLRMADSYLVPRGDGRYVLGATMEERGFDTSVTAGAMFELLRDAMELLPGLDELVIDEFCAGIRPGTPDNLPVIGAGALPGLHWATGHYRNGILLAPITASLVAAQLADGSALDGCEAVAADRFSVGAPA